MSFMPMMYYETHTVPIWVVVEEGPKQQDVIDWFVKREARLIQNPAEGFLGTYESLRDKGWGDMVAKTKRHTDILLQAFMLHSKARLNPVLDIVPDHPLVARMSRDLPTKEDMELFYNQLLSLLGNRSLSQLFMVKEICYPSSEKGCKVFVSDDSVDSEVVRRLGKEIVIIGSSEKASITYDQLGTKLSTNLTSFMKTVLANLKP